MVFLNVFALKSVFPEVERGRFTPENKLISIKPAKGCPMLNWVGKRPLRNVIAYPAQMVDVEVRDNNMGLSK